MKNLTAIFLVFIITQLPVSASRIHPEKDYQYHWCRLHNGSAEYRLSNATRVDCITQDYAIEFDFANKWAESVGQSLYYAISTNKKPGVVLIIENANKDKKYLERLQNVANLHNIKVWTITPQDLVGSAFCK